MCLMELVNIPETQNADVPICVSVLDDGAQASFVISGALDAGMTSTGGSLSGNPIDNAANIPMGNYCGTCSQTGSSTLNKCPMSPDPTTGFKQASNASGSTVDTFPNWASFFANSAECTKQFSGQTCLQVSTQL